MTFSNVSSFNSTYKALSSANIAKESSTIKKGGAFAPNFAEATSIMRASFDNQWENAYIIKYQALMQNRLNALKQELTAAYNNLLQQAASQQIRENGSNNEISATTDVYGRMLPGTASNTTRTAGGAAGTNNISVADATGFHIDDTLVVGGNTYYITDVVGNVITVSTNFVASVPANAVVTGGRNDAFKGLKYYDDKLALDNADDNGLWDRPAGDLTGVLTDSATQSDGVPSYYIGANTANDNTYQYSNTLGPDGLPVKVNTAKENYEMRKLYVSGPAMQIANDMRVTFRSEEVVPKATEYDSFFGGLMPPATNPAFKGGEKVAEYSTEVKTGGFWATVNYLYDFSPRELKYAYATSYSTTTEESGTRNYTEAGMKRQATLFSTNLIDSRDAQNTLTGAAETNEDGNSFDTLALDGMAGTGATNYPKLGARIKWSTSNPEEGYVTERNTLIELNNENDKQGAVAVVSSIDGRLITRRESDNDTNFPFLGTDFNAFNDVVKGDAANPWSGYLTSPTNSPDQRENSVKLYGTEEGGVTSMDSRIKWEYQHDGNGALDINRDAWIVGNTSGSITAPTGGASIPSTGVVINNASANFAYFVPPSTVPTYVAAGSSVTIPAGATGIVPPLGMDIAGSDSITLKAGNSFVYSPGPTSVASGATVTMPAGVSGASVAGAIPANGITLKNGATPFTYNTSGTPVTAVAGSSVSIPAGSTGSISSGSTATLSSALDIPANGITVNTLSGPLNLSVGAGGLTIPASGLFLPTVGATFDYFNPALVNVPAGATNITIPAGATGVVSSGSTANVPSGATNVVITAGTNGTNPTVDKIPSGSSVTAPASGLPIPSAGITVNNVATDFTYTPASGTVTVPAFASADIPAGSTGTIPAGAISKIPAGSVINIPAGSTYTPPASALGNADPTHVATAAFINHYQVAVQSVELNSNPDSYGRVLAIGHTRVNSNVATNDPYSDAADPMNAVASAVLRSGGIDASMDHTFSDIDNKYDAQGKLIHQNSVDPDGNGQSTNEKMMLPGSGKIAKNFTPTYVENLHQITSFNGQALGAHGGNVTISSESANNTPIVLGEYEGFKRAQSMSIGLAHDTYNDMGQQVRSYTDALALKEKIEAEINASNMVDTDWHYSEYASSTGGSTLDGIMFRNVRKITYNDPDKGAGEFNIYYDQSRRDDPNSDTFQYVDPTTGLSNSTQGTNEDTFDNVNVAFRKTFKLTNDQFQTLDYTQINALASNPIAAISPDSYVTSPTYKNRDVFINVSTQNVDTDSLDLIVNGHVVSGLINNTLGTAIYNIAPYLQEGENVIASQMRIDKSVVPGVNGKPSATGSNDYFKLESDPTNDKDITSWISAKISTSRTSGGDVSSTELTSSSNAGVMLSSWQSKIMANEVRPSLYESIYPSTISNPPGVDPAKFYVDEFTGQITAESRTTPAPNFYVPGTNTVYVPGVDDIPMTEKAYNSYGEALMGLASNKTATKVKDSNTFLKILMDAMNKKEYQDIFALGLLNSSLGKDIILKGQTSSPSGGAIQSILTVKYDNINNKFSLVQSKWDASAGPQQA